MLDPNGIDYSDKRVWRQSPYAHNMLIINPSAAEDSLFFGHKIIYRPVSGIQDFNKSMLSMAEIAPDPCFREYFQKNEQIDVLKLSLDYRNRAHANLPIEQQLPIANLKRSFVRDDEVFVVYDKVNTLDAINQDYWNLLHFGADLTNTNDSIILTDYGYSTNIGGDRVDVACGSFSPGYNHIIQDGLNNPVTSQLGHFTTPGVLEYKRGKLIVQNAISPSFLTVMNPNPNTVASIAEHTTVSNNSYAVSLTGNSSYNASEERLTYIGITNGDSQEVVFSESDIDTDAEYFMVSELPASTELTLEKSLVLMEGNYFSIDDEDVVRIYDTVVDGITVTYNTNSIGIVVQNDVALFPRLKIYRNESEPNLFEASLRMYDGSAGSDPIPYPDDPDYRFTTMNIMQSFAYDGTYFYVNYSWDDLVQAGLVAAGNLTIVKGVVGQHNLGSMLTLDGEIRVTGDITIRDIGCLNIESDADLRFDQDCGIHCYGELNISGADSNAALRSFVLSTPWDGIVVYPNGILNCSKADISGASIGLYLIGQAIVYDCLIEDCGTGIEIASDCEFDIDDCLVQGNTTGLYIANNYAIKSNVIANNEFTNNYTALTIYNSNTAIIGNNIHDNTNSGMYLIHNSEPVLTSNQITLTESSTTVLPEITLASDSYPILDYGYNDINTDGFGTSLFYSASGGRPHSIKARYNYWGTTNSAAIAASILPSTWEVGFNPYCSEPNTDFQMQQSSFFLALDAEENYDLQLASQLYSDIIDSEPDSLHALHSLGRLNSIYAKDNTIVSDLHSIYAGYLASCSDSLFLKSAEKKLIMLDRFDQQYPYAIQSYENLLYDASSEMDSLLCLLDIAYTMQEMYEGEEGKGTYSVQSYHANGISISNIKEAKNTILCLWDRIQANTQATLDYTPPVPVKLEVGNYPNPFNPITTITFTVPATSSLDMDIYNIKGQKVRELACGDYPRGFHKVVWDGKDDSGRGVASGVYFVKLNSSGVCVTRKVMLMK